jgi:regulator of replication initiation timing
MLDWLNKNQAALNAEASQILDAPETPAPVFAYRALKGILFGSPDYDDEDDDKENVTPATPIEKPKKAVQKADRRGRVDSSSLQLNLAQLPNARRREEYQVSPSPRKRRQVSPTKSILRTPGIPTPRRQNINVTFKDVRLSASPTAVNAKLLPARKEPTAATQSPQATKVDVNTTGSAPPGTVNAAEEAEILPAPVYDMSAVDAYLTSTEREMKKLVRYAQKMKEYARVSQQENAALKVEINQLKRELEELRKAKTMTRGASDEKIVEKASNNGMAARKRAGGMAAENNIKARVPAVELLGQIRPATATKSRNIDRNNAGTTVGKGRTQSGAELPGQKEPAGILAPNKGQHSELVSKKRAASKAQLPPDRLAAAKERLRVKSEERRRALGTDVG